jgi:hypothetical protein
MSLDTIAVRDPRAARTELPRLRRMTVAIWRDLMAEARDTGYFTRTYGSSWRTRVSDLRLHLEAMTPRLTVRTRAIPGSACKLYSIEAAA